MVRRVRARRLQHRHSMVGLRNILPAKQHPRRMVHGERGLQRPREVLIVGTIVVFTVVILPPGVASEDGDSTLCVTAAALDQDVLEYCDGGDGQKQPFPRLPSRSSRSASHPAPSTRIDALAAMLGSSISSKSELLRKGSLGDWASGKSGSPPSLSISTAAFRLPIFAEFISGIARRSGENARQRAAHSLSAILGADSFINIIERAKEGKVIRGSKSTATSNLASRDGSPPSFLRRHAPCCWEDSLPRWCRTLAPSRGGEKVRRHPRNV